MIFFMQALRKFTRLILIPPEHHINDFLNTSINEIDPSEFDAFKHTSQRFSLCKLQRQLIIESSEPAPFQFSNQ